MSIAESVDSRHYLAYQNGRAAFLLSELLSGEPSRFVRFEAQTWLKQHDAWLSDADDDEGENDPWQYDGDDEDDEMPEGAGNRVLYSEGWL
ncbi:hypothetical protein ACI2LF_06090 [Kribbella sp. NPDC020789]